jgi:hypothetical protein|tara:strand:- start:598 stop:771 length:174 start_codon:yes stop_codon:yes gene_type:complete
MNEREQIFYFLGAMGDTTKEEALDALENYTDFSRDQLNKIIDELTHFNNLFLKKYSD